MGLMKMTTYYKMCGDHVRFFKGDLLDLAAEILIDELLPILNASKKIAIMGSSSKPWRIYYKEIFNYVRKGELKDVEQISDIIDDESIMDLLKNTHLRFKKRDYFKTPKYDKVGITTLFTFNWEATIKAIKFALRLCKKKEDVMVCGIMSSLLPNESGRDVDEHNSIIV